MDVVTVKDKSECETATRLQASFFLALSNQKQEIVNTASAGERQCHSTAGNFLKAGHNEVMTYGHIGVTHFFGRYTRISAA